MRAKFPSTVLRMLAKYPRARAFGGRIKRKLLRQTGRGGASPAPSLPPEDAGPGGWSGLLSDDPIIVACWSIPDFPLGAMSVPGALSGLAAHTLVLPAWSLEIPTMSARLSEAVHRHRQTAPQHAFTIIGNTDGEVEAMRSQGCESILVNANCFVDEMVFRPLPHVEPEFDAVYNGRLSPDKRHELAIDVKSLALIYFVNFLEHTVETFHASHARHRLMLPDAEFINPLTPEGCRRLEPAAVNEVYARSRVGLCLSAVEGAMRVSMEYMMAGLPLVSTRNIGGRDHFFDPDYCVVVDDDPRCVREAVDALVARSIPRDYIRERTLRRVRASRTRLAEYIDSLIENGGGTPDFADRMESLLRAGKIMYWQPLEPFIRSVAQMQSASQAFHTGRRG